MSICERLRVARGYSTYVCFPECHFSVVHVFVNSKNSVNILWFLHVGLSIEDIRMRFLQLKYMNSRLSPLFTVVDLRCPHPLSLGRLLCKVSPYLFYDSKVSNLHSVLNASTRRSFDQAPPEIKMDPLESVTGFASTPLNTHFCQAAQQLSAIPSAQLCIPLASGGDPTYAFNVKMSGEEVHGTSKWSFDPHTPSSICLMNACS